MMASQKSLPSDVAAAFQDLDIHVYLFTPEKQRSLGGQNFC